MRRAATAIVATLMIAAILPADAHHPGADLERIMGSKERYFQVIDQPAPAISLRAADGANVALTDYSGKVIVLHFVYASCPDVCPLHAEKLAEAQRMINDTPMRDMVRFVTITTDPANDTSDVLNDYGKAHGLDAANWTMLTTRPGQDEDTTRKLAETFGHKFTKVEGGYQTHGVVTHIIDQNGRWAGNFHGLRFETVNLVLYINGLINRAHAPAPKPGKGWWDRLKEVF